jgi:hypothetical protein
MYIGKVFAVLFVGVFLYQYQKIKIKKSKSFFIICIPTGGSAPEPKSLLALDLVWHFFGFVSHLGPKIG